MAAGRPVRVRSRWLFAGVLPVLSVVWFVATGSSLPSALAITAALAAQTLSGSEMWRGITRRRSRGCDWTELVGMGFALGSAVSLGSGLLLRPWTPWGWAVPCAITLAWWAIRRGFLAGAAAPSVISRRAALGAGIAIALGLAAALVNLARYPLVWSGTWSGYHPDMLFFEALSTSLARFAPWDTIFVPGGWVHYHWFAFAWSGQLGVSLGLEPFVGLTRVLPFVATVSAAALAAGWTTRLTRAAWAPALAGVLITAGGFVGAAYGTLLNIDSPSQAMSTVWLLAAVYLVVELLEGQLGRWALLPLALLGAVAMGSKLSSAAVLIGALAIATAISWLVRSPWRHRGAAALAVVTGAGASVYALFLAGAASSGDLLLFTLQYRASSVQGLDTGYGGIGVMVGTVLLAVSIVPRWAGVMGLWVDREARVSPMGLLSVGFVICGIAPLAVLSQGVNELWFALAASVPLAVFSTVGLARWWDQTGSRRGLLVSVICGILVLLVVTVVWARGETGTVSIRALGPALAIALAALAAWAIARWSRWRSAVAVVMVGCTVLVAAGALARLAPVLGRVGNQSTTSAVAELSADVASGSGTNAESTTVDPIDYGNAWSSAEVDAARWLAANTDTSDVIVTDRTRPALVPALTGRRTYVSAEQYLADYASRQTAEAAPVLARIAKRFGAAPTETDYSEMCAAGVTFGWFTGSIGVSGAPYTTVVYRNDKVTVVKVDRRGCPAP